MAVTVMVMVKARMIARMTARMIVAWKKAQSMAVRGHAGSESRCKRICDETRSENAAPNSALEEGREVHRLVTDHRPTARR